MKNTKFARFCAQISSKTQKTQKTCVLRSNQLRTHQNTCFEWKNTKFTTFCAEISSNSLPATRSHQTTKPYGAREGVTSWATSVCLPAFQITPDTVQTEPRRS